MKPEPATAQDTINYIACQMDELFKRPLMYGGDINGVETTFLVSVDLYDYIRQEKLRAFDVWRHHYSKTYKTGALSLASYLNRTIPDRDKAVDLLVEQMKSFWEQYK